MKSAFVKLTVPQKLYDESMKIVKEFGYSNVQELALQGLRKEIIELKEKQQILANIKRLQGSAQPRPRLTTAEKEKIVREHTPERSAAMTKKYGLEDVTI